MTFNALAGQIPGSRTRTERQDAPAVRRDIANVGAVERGSQAAIAAVATARNQAQQIQIQLAAKQVELLASIDEGLRAAGLIKEGPPAVANLGFN